MIEVAEEAFFNGVVEPIRNQIRYVTKSGMKVRLNLDAAGKIVSWFPEV